MVLGHTIISLGKSLMKYLGLLVFLLIPSVAFSKPLSEKEVLAITYNTKEIQEFIKQYTCDGCKPDYAKGKTAIIGCVEYKATERPESWEVDYWVSDNCSFRGGSSKTRVQVILNKSGNVTSTKPSYDYIANFDYCESDKDCRALSGSGVPFTGCANAFHAYSNWSGSYEDQRCKCIKNKCDDVDHN